MEKNSNFKIFSNNLKSMLNVDFRRMFTMPLVYIMAGISLVIPVLVLIMTNTMGATDPATGAEAAEAFTNVWQAFGSESGTQAAMDLTGMCNINLVYFLVAVLVCVFVAGDFKSGYAKNLFAVRPEKLSYVASKTLAGFVGGAVMIAAYIAGAMIGGAIAGLSFDVGAAKVSGIVCCLLSKFFLTAVFVSVYVLFGVIGKQKLWLSLICSLAAGMLLFTMIPVISPLDSSALNVVMCLVGGAIFGVGLCEVGKCILNRTDLV